MSRNPRQIFRPGSYSEENESHISDDESGESSSYETMVSSSTIISESMITTKGGKKKKELKIKVAELNSLVEDLRYNSDKKINRITGEIKVKFGQLKHLVTLLYDTNSYNILVDMVNKHFKDLETIIPGTIGAYCIGCERGSECSPICAGSMPMDNNGENCKDTVILAEYNNGRYDFTLLKTRTETESTESTESSKSSSEYRTDGFERGSKSDKRHNSGYVFVPHTTLDDFAGFTKREKRMLEKLGVDHVNLYGYNENGDDQFKLDSGHIDHIKARSGKGRRHQGESGSGGNDNTFIFIFVIFFIIFLLVAGFLLANKWRYGHL